MDNEPEIWSGTHDDLMPQLIAAGDTCISHTKNALKQTEITIKGNLLPLSLPAMSVTSIQLTRNK